MVMEQNNTAVKMIINGRKYDTATALLIFKGGAYEDRYNKLELELYRNRFGKFFTVMRDLPDGDELKPIDDKEALKLMEEYANDKIEDYFDIDEAGASLQASEKLTEVQVAFRMPKFLLDRAKMKAKAKGLSFNTWAIRAFESTFDLEKADEE